MSVSIVLMMASLSHCSVVYGNVGLILLISAGVMLLLSMGSCVSATSVVGISSCVTVVVRLFPRRLKIVSSISSATGNSIGAIELF